MNTLHPLILTACISDKDLKPFDVLRQKHFPPDRNFIRAHLTMFHRLPGEYSVSIIQHLAQITERNRTITAKVSGIVQLGAGVAFTISSPELQEIRTELKAAFLTWLGPQDMQKWQPHITIQNKVSRAAADSLHRDLMKTFRPHSIELIGLDLWRYLSGPWRHESSAMFIQDA